MTRAAVLIVLLAACTQQKVPEDVAEPIAARAPGGSARPPATTEATANADPGHGDAPVPAHTNRLAQESSPYLLQHQHNPVDWYPWGEEAFEKAKREDKPIFLSIGYSTCHWCHVMERESFENEEIAAVMNEHYVCIKVDREERPDVDAIYMNAIQETQRGGGWPLSAWLTHDRKPFALGTYFPPEDRYGREGFKTILVRAAELWRTRRADLERSADLIIDAVRQNNTARGGEELSEGTLRLGAEQFTAEFDAQWGGFNRGRAPKFPRSFALSFLLRQRTRGNAEQLLTVVEKTLEQMRLGGLQDQLGGGFHRYSTDREWLLPHFEKMLYDQAFLACTYLDAFVVTGNAEYERTARGIFTYVLRDLQDEAGGFHSAEDADSEGVEGKFYVWTRSEILEHLGEDEGGLFCDIYRVSADGNFKEEATGHATGDNILHLSKPLAEHAVERGTQAPAFEARIAAMREKLLGVRSTRVRPSLDDKVLTDWNGMMISAFARGGAVLDDPTYTRAAERAAEFLLATMRPAKGTLLHRYRKGQAGIPAFLEDYAFLTIGLVDLYETTLDARWLAAAHELAGEMLLKFRDREGGGFVLASPEGEELVAETKELYDGATPSGNSAAALALLRVGRLTMDEKLSSEGRATLAAWSGLLARAPYMYPYSMTALDLDVGPAQEIVIAGDPAADGTRDLLREVRRRFLPRAALILHPSGEAGAAIRKLVPFVENQRSVDGKPTAYVCENYACKAPVTTPAALAALLDRIAGN